MKIVMKRAEGVSLKKVVRAALVCVRPDGRTMLLWAASGRSNRVVRVRAKARARSPYGRPLNLK